jgi:MSHA biogenesis protein MshO
MNRQRGFTLVEMIMAIVITGIVAGMVAVFIARPVQGYVDSVRRAGLTDLADLALKRMSLEIRNAVPNTIPPISGSSSVQFLPSSGGGRYCSDIAPDSCVNRLTTASGSSFDVLGPMPTAKKDDQIVIFNTGQSGLDVYESPNGNCGNINVDPVAKTLTYDTKAFPILPEYHRFSIAPSSGPVRFGCTATQLQRTVGVATFCGITPTALAPTVLASADSVDCHFSYTPVSKDHGLLSLKLTLTNSGESVTLMQQIHVNNLP